jgi:hypothetical protein
MESKSILDYILFGTALRFLQDAAAGWPIHAPDGTGTMILGNILAFFDHLNASSLTVTERAANTELRKLSKQFEALPKDHVLTEEEAFNLRTTVNTLRATLHAEAGGHFAFIVTDKRLQVTRLLNDVGALFAPGTVDALPAIAKYDLA